MATPTGAWTLVRPEKVPWVVRHSRALRGIMGAARARRLAQPIAGDVTSARPIRAQAESVQVEPLQRRRATRCCNVNLRCPVTPIANSPGTFADHEHQNPADVLSRALAYIKWPITFTVATCRQKSRACAQTAQCRRDARCETLGRRKWMRRRPIDGTQKYGQKVYRDCGTNYN